MKKPEFLTTKSTVLVLGVILGVLLLATIRVATYKVDHKHYHANFAVYLNGEREDFSEPKYYQEVAICKVGQEITNPQERAHLHENKNSIIHVHDHAVTWGQFFENIGWSIGPDFIVNDKGVMFRADDQNKLNIMIDGQDYTDLNSVSNMVIKDLSKLLVSYGPTNTAALEEQFKSFPSTAKEANESNDPSSCASREAIPFKERLKNAF